MYQPPPTVIHAQQAHEMLWDSSTLDHTLLSHSRLQEPLGRPAAEGQLSLQPARPPTPSAGTGALSCQVPAGCFMGRPFPGRAQGCEALGPLPDLWPVVTSCLPELLRLQWA